MKKLITLSIAACMLSMVSFQMAHADSDRVTLLIGEWVATNDDAYLQFSEGGIAVGGKAFDGMKKKGTYTIDSDGMLTTEFRFSRWFCRCNKNAFSFQGQDMLLMGGVVETATRFERVNPAYWVRQLSILKSSTRKRAATAKVVVTK